MYVRMITFDINPEYKGNAKSFAEIFNQRLTQYEGFISIEFLYNLERGVVKTLARWESEELADAAFEDFSKSLDFAAQGFGSGNYETCGFDVFEVAAASY